jgi:hypothetical protein
VGQCFDFGARRSERGRGRVDEVWGVFDGSHDEKIMIYLLHLMM